MSWQLLALSSVAMFTALSLVQRIVAVESKNQRAMAVAFNIAAGLTATLFFFITGSYKSFTLPNNYMAYVSLGCATIFYGMYERGRFQAARLLEASVLTTITNISVAVAFIGAAILYHESITTPKLIGSILILVALFLVSYNKSPTKSSRNGVIIALLISIMLGLGWMLDKAGTYYFNYATYSILTWTVPIIIIYLPYVKFSDIKGEFKNSSWKIWLMAILNVIGYLLQLKALETAEATRVIPIIQTSTLFTVLLGMLILNERDRVKIKLVAGLLAVMGAIFLV